MAESNDLLQQLVERRWELHPRLKKGSQERVKDRSKILAQGLLDQELLQHGPFRKEINKKEKRKKRKVKKEEEFCFVGKIEKLSTKKMKGENGVYFFFFQTKREKFSATRNSKQKGPKKSSQSSVA